jgi:hypothetical protein
MLNAPCALIKTIKALLNVKSAVIISILQGNPNSNLKKSQSQRNLRLTTALPVLLKINWKRLYVRFAKRPSL